MTDGMLSQDEINALLGNIATEEVDANNQLNDEEIDALGEIGNISMGTAATTLFSLLNHKVMITTPKVEVITKKEFEEMLNEQLIAISVDYTIGLTGANLLLLNEKDVRIITDLMMGGEGNPAEEELSEFHLSAIAEAMNQMVGSSSTSMSQMFDKKIDISPPKAMQTSSQAENLEQFIQGEETLVKISFRIQILENIIDSELMQVIPISFAKDLVQNLLGQHEELIDEINQALEAEEKKSSPPPSRSVEPTPAPAPTPPPSPIQNNYNNYAEPPYRPEKAARNVEAQSIEFPTFDRAPVAYPKENMDVLMDVPLEVSVELGRTHKKIKEILEFGPGSVIELNKLVGEPVDVLVNGKYIAKGEVVVIDENFGIRITDIINTENRI